MQRILFVFLFVGLWAAGPAHAADSEAADDTTTARALFHRGLAHADAGRWPEAANCFERARALRDTPEITYNLSTALLELGELVRAHGLLEPLLLAPAVNPEVRQAAELRLKEIETRLAQRSAIARAGQSEPAAAWAAEPGSRPAEGFAVPTPPAKAERPPPPIALDGRAAQSAPIGGSPVDAARTAGVGSRRGWLWAVVGAVAIGVTTATVIATRDESEPVMGNVATWTLGEK